MGKSQNNTVGQSRRVVGYVRISKDREEETSTTTQADAIKAWCNLHGHTLVRMIIEPGRSAFKESRKTRPGFREARQLIASGAADCFACWKVDRTARNALDLLQLVEELQGQGAEFVSVTESIDTTSATGELLLALLGALARMESRTKSDRAAAWHEYRRINATVPSGPAPLGYRKPAPNRLELDPDVAPLVRQAAEHVANGGSFNAAVTMLNKAGVKISNPGLKTALTSATMIAHVALTKPERRGGVPQVDVDDMAPGDWEPLLDRTTWDAVRAALADPDRRTLPSNVLRWPLVPIVRCHCGSRMRHHIDKYRTKSGTQELGRLLCLDQSCLNGIGYAKTEEAVTAAVLDYLDDEVWNRFRSATHAAPEPDAVAAAARLERMWQMVLDGTIEPEEYAEAKARWAGEMVATMTAPAELPAVDDVRVAWPDLTAQERLLVFRAVIERFAIKPATRRGGRGVDLERLDLELI